MKSKIPWELLISHLKKEASEADESQLAQWRNAGTNDTLYRELVSLWHEISGDAASYHPDTAYYWQRMEARMLQKEAAEAAEAAVSKGQAHTWRKMWRSVAAASVALLIAAPISYYLGKRNSHLKEHSGYVQRCSSLDGKTQMVLPDGTSVWLNTGSSLSYEMSFMQNRVISLEGEAMFDVKRDSKHPFMVKAKDLQVIVHGTRFNVQAYEDNPDVRVALLEGKVSLSAEGRIQELHPGEIASYNKASQMISFVKGGDIEFETFWANNSCTFNAISLRFICQYLERWYHVSIELDSSIADTQVYTFTITDEPLEMVLQIMSSINPIEYSFERNRRVRINKKFPKL
ncbi:MAG: FecR domain-containing protein [Tannerellaceae bacterium]|jgi:ferric-dicitrate binding protein FerR (iron transport regulator)|nr:FecR domain-containing protein [Tannerellaceae bacterium]